MVQKHDFNLARESFGPGYQWETIECDVEYFYELGFEGFHAHL